MRSLFFGVVLLIVSASPAYSVPSVDVIWRETQSATIAASVSASVVADIVLRGEFPDSISGIFVTIEFDETELQAIGGVESVLVNLPGMGHFFSPVVSGVTIDNALGRVTNFEQATLGTGLQGSDSRTLGSIKFHVFNPTGVSGEEDVKVSLVNTGVDAIVIDSATLEAGPGLSGNIEFGSADVIPVAVPEPVTGLLVIAGLGMLVYGVGRRS